MDRIDKINEIAMNILNEKERVKTEKKWKILVTPVNIILVMNLIIVLDVMGETSILH